MGDRRLDQLLFHLRHRGGTLLRHLGVRLHHRGFGHRLFVEIGKDFRRAFQRDKMVDVEIDRLGLQV